MTQPADRTVVATTRATPRPVYAWDIVLTVVFLLGMLAVGLWGGLQGLLALAFMDTCPPEGCSGGPIYVRWLGGAVLGFVAFAASIILLVLRRRGWWVALVGFVAMTVLWGELLAAQILYALR